MEVRRVKNLAALGEGNSAAGREVVFTTKLGQDKAGVSSRRGRFC